MSISTKVPLSLAALAVIAFHGTARADDVADIARQVNLPVPVVDSVLRNVTAFFATAQAPANRLTSGLFEELSLKALRNRMDDLTDSQPGKASQANAQKENATYGVTVRVTRHDITETHDCVDTAVTLSAVEALPVIQGGSFTFDSAHPKTGTYSWPLTFCRTPINGGTDYSDWQMTSAAK